MGRVKIAVGLLVPIALLSMGAPALAQTQPGKSEVTTFALVSTSFAEGFTTSQAVLLFNYARSLTENDQVGAGPVIFLVRAAGRTDSSIGLNSFYRRFLRPRGGGEIRPYVGGEFLVFDLTPSAGSSIADSSFINGIGGIKYYFTDNVALDTKASFGFSPGGSGQALQLTLGISYSF